MSDLDDLLLEAAGRTNTPNRRSSPPPKRRSKVSYSGEDSDGDRNYSIKRVSGSQFPLKKRYDASEKDNGHSSHEEDDNGYGHEHDSDDDSVGSDLYKDEDDRRNLAQMSELERETILAERAAKKSDRNLHDTFRRAPQTQLRETRSSTRTADKAAARGDALNEIRAKQKRQQGPASGKQEYSPVKRRSYTAATIGGSSPVGGGSFSDEESTGDGGMDDSDEDKTQVPSFDDIKDITIRRSKLSRWFMEPFFDDLIVGCFVRVGIGRSRSGPIYRLSWVRNVDASDPDKQYKLDNKTTSKYLNVIWGNEASAARWQMAMVSDSAPRKEEYDQWVREVERTNGRMPSKQEVLDKKESIRKTNSFVYSAETVKQMLQEKKSATWRPLNIAAEKDRLRREMEVAKMRNDESEVERIVERLEELEAARKAPEKDEKALRLAEMNRKNKVENFKNASDLKRVGVTLKAGDSGYDPFSRRWTRSRNYYVGKSGTGKDDGDAAKAASGGGVAGDSGIAATEAALESAADAGKLIDTSAPSQMYSLQNFDRTISLIALKNFGGPQGVQAGHLARRQKIEATFGQKVPEEDGKRHTLTLSISDYKRRRGLL